MADRSELRGSADSDPLKRAVRNVYDGNPMAKESIERCKKLFSMLSDVAFLGALSAAIEAEVAFAQQDDPSIPAHELPRRYLEHEHGIETSADFLQNALSTLPYLDANRAVRLYGIALDEARGFEASAPVAASSLPHLTLMAGEAAYPLWEQALGHPQPSIREYTHEILREKQPDLLSLGIPPSAVERLAGMAQ